MEENTHENSEEISEKTEENIVSTSSELNSDEVEVAAIEEASVDNQTLPTEDEVEGIEKENELIKTSESIVDTPDNSNELITVRPVKFKEFTPTDPNRAVKINYDILQDVSMHISVELGRTKSSIKEVMDFTKGSIVELDKIAGEQVEIYVNDKIVAKGEVIVIEDKFGVRVTSTTIPKKIE